jgi:short subunit dehydrogenase-like uncharacterized protein
MKVLLYGANGYTGRLIAESWPEAAHTLILGGRSARSVGELASRLGKEDRIFDLEDRIGTAEALQDIDLVLNAAGPFFQTAQPLVEACLSTKAHYVDITGEIEVFETIQSYHNEAQAQGIVLLPGAGFDVVPTDVLAAKLAEKQAEAQSLTLAIASFGTTISHGTLSTAVSQLGKRGSVRKDHKLVPEVVGKEGRYFEFGDKKRFAMSIPWGDISTAYWSTGIPNIRVFMATPPSTYRKMKWQWLFNPILRWSWVKKRIQRYVDQNVSGPTEKQRQEGFARVYGEVTDAAGHRLSLQLESPEPYAFTARSAIWFANHILDHPGRTGYFTPSTWADSDEVLGALDMTVWETED